jgi:hypothetical protein
MLKEYFREMAGTRKNAKKRKKRRKKERANWHITV